MDGSKPLEQPLAAPDVQKAPPPPEDTSRWLLLGIAAAALIGVGIAAFFLLGMRDTAEPMVEPEEKPVGTISLSLVAAGGNGSAPARLHTYDLVSGQLTERASVMAGHAYQGSVSPDGSKLLYIAQPLATSLEEAMASRPQVHVSDILPDGSLGVASQITTSDGLKGNPSWSPDGTRIAYTINPVTRDAETLPEEWEVHVTDLNGTSMLVTTGLYPHWSPDATQLMVLKNGGIWIVDIDDGESRQVVWTAEGETAHVSMQFDVSADGTMIALPIASNGKIQLFALNSWGTDALATHQEDIAVPAFWPHFSPDGRYVAFEALDVAPGGAVGTITGQRLSVYDRETKETVDLLDLNAYDQNSMWIDQWTVAETSSQVSGEGGWSLSDALATVAHAWSTADCPNPTLIDYIESIDTSVWDCGNGNFHVGSPGCDNDMGTFPRHDAGGGDDGGSVWDDDDCPPSEAYCDGNNNNNDGNNNEPVVDMNIRLRGVLPGNTCNPGSSPTTLSNVPPGTALTLCWNDTRGNARSCTARSNPTNSGNYFGFSTGSGQSVSGSDTTNALGASPATIRFYVDCRDQNNGTATSNEFRVNMSEFGTPTITVDRERVPEGSQVTVTYNTGNRPGCTLQSAFGNQGVSASTSNQTIQYTVEGLGDVVFTLACPGVAAVNSPTVQVIPEFQEI